MHTVQITAYFCGLSDELFAPNMMLSRPFRCYQKVYRCDGELSLSSRASEMIGRFQQDARREGSLQEGWESENLRVDTIYLRTEEALLGLREDKRLSDVFAYFGSDHLEFVYICAVGGASFCCDGYQFIVHPREDIHRYQPHVHVRRNGDETRYSLDSLTRFSDDSFSREFRRDEKKIIIPYLQRNREKLYQYWQHYMNGYTLPAEDERGMQYYKES